VATYNIGNSSFSDNANEFNVLMLSNSTGGILNSLGSVTVNGGTFNSTSDLILQDNNGAYFIARDNSSGFSYLSLNGSSFSPVQPFKPVTANVALSNVTVNVGTVTMAGGYLDNINGGLINVNNVFQTVNTMAVGGFMDVNNVFQTVNSNIRNTVNVSIQGTPTFSISGGGVTVLNTANVAVLSNVSVTVNNTANVFILNVPTVAITGVPSVTVNNTVNTNVLNTANVNVLGTPNVNIPLTANVNVLNTVNGNILNTVNVSIQGFTAITNTNIINTANVTILNTANVDILGTANVQILNVNVVSTATGNTMKESIADPTTGVMAAVQALHNSDNLTLGGGNFGLLTGGVSAILNQSGSVDRVRETGFDGIAAVGISTGTSQLASPLLTTSVISGAITASGTPQSVNVASFSFNNRGVNTAFQVGSQIIVDQGAANQEFIYVSAINLVTNTITGIFTKGHVASVPVSTFTYSQGRDSTIPDGSTPAGIAASGEYLFNAISNTVEFQRSAAGELDGATGKGTNIALEYEYNSGGPMFNSTGLSGLAYDRSRNLQGKGLAATGANVAITAGANSFVVNTSIGTAWTLQAGSQLILDRNTANQEAAYVNTSYVSGNVTIGLQANLFFAHAAGATIEWDAFASGGPGLNGFSATGIGIEEDVVFNPGDGKYYIERAMTNDGAAGNNIPMEGVALYNGTNFDRWRGDLTNGAFVNIKNSVNLNSTIVGGGQTVAVKAASTPAAATDPALVVTISPNGVNPDGQATMANSAPVVIASDQSPIAVTGSFTSSLSGNSANSIYVTTNSTAVVNVAGSIYALGNSLAAVYVTSNATALVNVNMVSTGMGNSTSALFVTTNSTAVINVGLVSAVGVGNSTSALYVTSNSTALLNVSTTAIGYIGQPPAVANNTRTQLAADKQGRLITVGSSRLLKDTGGNTFTATTASQTIIPAVATTFCDLYGIIIENTSLTGTEVLISDGTVVFPIYAPPQDTRGFMMSVDSAIPATTAGVAWTANCVTSVSSIKITTLYALNL
jgi:hypothetical protein